MDQINTFLFILSVLIVIGVLVMCIVKMGIWIFLGIVFLAVLAKRIFSNNGS